LPDPPEPPAPLEPPRPAAPPNPVDPAAPLPPFPPDPFDPVEPALPDDIDPAPPIAVEPPDPAAFGFSTVVESPPTESDSVPLIDPAHATNAIGRRPNQRRTSHVGHRMKYLVVQKVDHVIADLVDPDHTRS
jgi:hypothetical protein